MKNSLRLILIPIFIFCFIGILYWTFDFFGGIYLIFDAPLILVVFFFISYFLFLFFLILLIFYRRNFVSYKNIIKLIFVIFLFLILLGFVLFRYRFGGQMSSNSSLGPNGLFGKCFPGYDTIASPYERNGVCELGVGGGVICSKCGDNKCSSWEDICNCPDDCKN